MASMVIPSRSGQHGGRGLRADDQTYYCFDCDRRLTIIATSDTGIIICPICGHLVLEEFETPSSTPSPPPALPPYPMPPPPPRSTTASVDLDSFFPTSSDIDSEVELFDPLPPPPPPLPFFFTTQINTTSTGAFTGGQVVDSLRQLHIYPPPLPPPPSYSRNIGDFHYNFDSDVRHLRLPSSPPLPPPPLVTDQRHLCPQFPDPSAPIPLPPSESELPLENSVPSSPPQAPSRSSDASDIFYSPSRDVEEEENPNQQHPFPPPLPPSISNTWDYFFPDIDLPPSSPANHENSSDLQPNSPPNHESSSFDLLPPPPPPPWLMSDLSVMKMTEELLSDWKSHQCSICIDNFEVNQMVRLTPCNHLYHSDCLLPWLDLHKSCPICRRKLSSQ